MSYANACASPCPTIPHFSNPNVSYMGIPTGIPAGAPGAADNALTFNLTAHIVAGWREAPPVIVSPQPGTTIPCGSVSTRTLIMRGLPITFSAQSRPGAQYVWSFGTTRGGADIDTVATGSSYSVTVDVPLRFFGLPLYARVSTEYDGITHFRDHEFRLDPNCIVWRGGWSDP